VLFRSCPPVTDPRPLSSRTSAHAALFAGLLLVSTAGPFIVLCGMDAFAVVVLRAAGAAVLFGLAALARGELGGLRPHARELAAGAFMLAAHWCLWIKAFDLTDYASNLLLLVAQPVAAAALGAWLGERTTHHVWISILLALAGLFAISGADVRLGARALAGDAMCVLSAVALAAFYPVTRRARAALPLDVFMAAVWAGVTALALPVAALAGARVSGYPARAWAWMAALVVLTTAGGHGFMNLAARQVKLFTLNVVIVLEPAIAIAIGAVAFGARVRALQVAGGVLLAAAVVSGLRHERA